MSMNNLPPDILLEILSRLPVKSIYRCKCVCKPWLSLFSDPKFIKHHKKITVQNPKNHLLLVAQDYSISVYNVNTMEEPIKLLIGQACHRWMPVGVCNGIVCLSYFTWANAIKLWNPATMQCKRIHFQDYENADDAAIGFGLGLKEDDFIVIRIGCKKSQGKAQIEVQVYYTISDAWKKIEVGFDFRLNSIRNCAIADGIPYWVAYVREPDIKDKFREILLWFDVKNEVFKQLELPHVDFHSGIRTRFVDLKDRLSLLMYSPTKELNNFLDVWSLDDNESFTKKFTIGPISLKIEMLVGCSLSGEILATSNFSKLYCIEPESNKSTYIYSYRDWDIYHEYWIDVFNYTESMISIEGMKKFGKEDEEEDSDTSKRSESNAAGSLWEILSKKFRSYVGRIRAN